MVLCWLPSHLLRVITQILTYLSALNLIQNESESKIVCTVLIIEKQQQFLTLHFGKKKWKFFWHIYNYHCALVSFINITSLINFSLNWVFACIWQLVMPLLENIYLYIVYTHLILYTMQCLHTDWNKSRLATRFSQYAHIIWNIYIYVLLYYTILTARTHEMNFNLAIRFLSVFGQIENILYIKGDFLRAIGKFCIHKNKHKIERSAWHIYEIFHANVDRLSPILDYLHLSHK